MSKFQIILTGIFAAFILIGVLVFAFFKGSAEEKVVVSVWGTIPQEAFQNAFSQTPLSKDKFVSVRYSAKNPATFNQEFVEALASGTGPDAVILPHDDILKNQNKFFPIPFETYSERDFKDTFVEEAELFLMPNGILAIPLTIDPLVMYWNRDLFANKAIASPPLYWDELYTLSQQLTEKDGSLSITRSAVALGEYGNVLHAKEILSALIFQAGSSIVARSGNSTYSTLTDSYGLPIAPAFAALTFYTEFSNPAKPFYSWNRSLPNSQSMFTSGDLALYFGFASELGTIRLKNPNLNFDVAPLPQSRTGNRKITYGDTYGMAIVRSSRSVAGAYTALVGLSARESALAFASVLRTPPARRDLLSGKAPDAYSQVFADSALWARGWLDPDTTETGLIFKNLIETVTAGRARLETALNRAHTELQNLIRRQ